MAPNYSKIVNKHRVLAGAGALGTILFMVLKYKKNAKINR